MYSTAQFKLYRHVQADTCAYTFNVCQTSKTECACTVACYFGMRMQPSEHTQHMRDACHELSLGLLHIHFTCGVTTGTVAVDKMQLFYSFFIYCNEHQLKILSQEKILRFLRN